MRKLKGSRENGMPSRVQLYEIFMNSPDAKKFANQDYLTIQRADLEEAAEKLLRIFGFQKDSRGYLPEDSPFHDFYGPSLLLLPTLANLIAYWIGIGESRKELLEEGDERILSDWPW